MTFENNKNFTILITTKNREDNLALTLEKLKHLITANIKIIICDDGSTDDTEEFIRTKYPEIQFIRNTKTLGLIQSRNNLMQLVKTPYAISLDDDAHFLGLNELTSLNNYFETNIKCGVVAFRVYWGKEEPKSTVTLEKPERVKGFVGCAHAWRLDAWNSVPDYPSWFIFYGEEDFAAYHLFKKGWEVHYFPDILVHHRVNILERKAEKEYVLRSRRSLRAGWYLYFLFLPWNYIPKKLIYTLWVQLKMKVFKGDFKSLKAILMAMMDLFLNIPHLLIHRTSLTREQYENFSKIPDSKIYWDGNK